MSGNPAALGVAQIFNLLYRRFLTCGRDELSAAFGIAFAVALSKALPTTSRRYSRLKICATKGVRVHLLGKSTKDATKVF